MTNNYAIEELFNAYRTLHPDLPEIKEKVRLLIDFIRENREILEYEIVIGEQEVLRQWSGKVREILCLPANELHPSSEPVHYGKKGFLLYQDAFNRAEFIEQCELLYYIPEDDTYLYLKSENVRDTMNLTSTRREEPQQLTLEQALEKIHVVHFQRLVGRIKNKMDKAEVLTQ